MKAMPGCPASTSRTWFRARHLPRGQVGLRDVARHHRLRAEPQPGEEHLHLLRRRVLRFVEDDERIVQGAAPHEREGRDLDHPALDQLLRLFQVHHVVERVVERAQIGVDLRLQVAGQKAEAFARPPRPGG